MNLFDFVSPVYSHVWIKHIKVEFIINITKLIIEFDVKRSQNKKKKSLKYHFFVGFYFSILLDFIFFYKKKKSFLL